MIKRFVVKKLHGKFDYDLTFNEDLNILTGSNGCGKTSLLKLMWYMLSGNKKKIFEEKIEFEMARVEFIEDGYKEAVSELIIDKKKGIVKYTDIPIPEIGQLEEEIEIKNIVDYFSSKQEFAAVINTCFLPTFRRIEGGFLVNKNQELLSAIANFKNQISIIYNFDGFQHKFILSISTHDIDEILTNAYADISEKLNEIRDAQAKFILEKAQNTNENGVLKEIQDRVKVDEQAKDVLFQPFTTLNKLIDTLFKDKGVAITDNVSVGNPKNRLSPDKLSSGEKQILSFLVYNAFSKNTVFFIDEPELSLHTDWQRLLVKMLVEQKSGNQLIMATHSPFIYAQYPDKDFYLDELNHVTAK